MLYIATGVKQFLLKIAEVLSTLNATEIDYNILYYCISLTI